MKWLSIGYWKYLLETSSDPHHCNWWIRFWCRVNNHPEGVIWYNVNRTHPDMRCKRCHDDLG